MNYEKKMPPSFVMPFLGAGYLQVPLDCFPVDATSQAVTAWNSAVYGAEAAYRLLIQCGVKPQIARSVFPNALASRLIATGNLRNWRHFLLMRTTAEARPRTRQATPPSLREFQDKIPSLYDDIAPEARQIDNLRKPR